MSPDDRASLAGRVAVVTGASRGIGRAICRRLSSCGASVVALDVLDCAETLSGLTGSGRHTAVHCDVSGAESVAAVGLRVRREYGRCDILVNNAGILSTGGLLETDVHQWRRVMAVNVDGMFLTARTFAPMMIDAGYGRIVNVGSTITRSQAVDLTAYMTSKGAVHALTRALANELGVHGVTVNAVAPRIVATEGLYGRDHAPGGLSHDQEVDLVASAQTIRRRQRPEDVANAVLYLALPETDFVTGQIVYVDGGLTRTGG